MKEPPDFSPRSEARAAMLSVVSERSCLKNVARPDGVFSNELFGVLEEWNTYLEAGEDWPTSVSAKLTNERCWQSGS
jgi:hypothetical protein